MIDKQEARCNASRDREESALPITAEPIADARRQLSTQLGLLRRNAGLVQAEAARIHEWSPSKVHRIENGHSTISRVDLLALLGCYRVTDEHLIDHLLDLARLSRGAAGPIGRRRTRHPGLAACPAETRHNRPTSERNDRS